MAKKARKPSEFTDSWENLLKVLIPYVRNTVSKTMPAGANKWFKGLLDDIGNDLLSDRALADVETTVTSARLTDDDKKLVDYLTREMHMWVAILAGSRDGNRRSAIRAGKTVKDSIEKLLELPKWLKDRLEILNELLSLV
jgi:hypothetical protein